jgi:hypothetical protein
MAYTQSPGRGDSPKTGSGIPDTFRQDTDPPKIELTKKFTEGVETLKKNRASDAKSTKGANSQGIEINPNTGEAKAKPYEKRFIKGGDGTNRSYSMIVGGDNKVVAQANSPVRNNPNSNEKLYSRYVKDSTSTMNQRNANAHFHNLTAGLIENRSEMDNETLIKLGKAVKVK